MSVHINQVIEYLDNHPICYYADGVDSLLKMLYDIYAAHNAIDSEELRGLYQKAACVLEKLPPADGERLFTLICELCLEHEQQAFIHGFFVGMCLMTEIRTVT